MTVIFLNYFIRNISSLVHYCTLTCFADSTFALILFMQSNIIIAGMISHGEYKRIRLVLCSTESASSNAQISNQQMRTVTTSSVPIIIKPNSCINVRSTILAFSHIYPEDRRRNLWQTKDRSRMGFAIARGKTSRRPIRWAVLGDRKWGPWMCRYTTAQIVDPKRNTIRLARMGSERHRKGQRRTGSLWGRQRRRDREFFPWCNVDRSGRKGNNNSNDEVIFNGLANQCVSLLKYPAKFAAIYGLKLFIFHIMLG